MIAFWEDHLFPDQKPLMMIGLMPMDSEHIPFLKKGQIVLPYGFYNKGDVITLSGFEQKENLSLNGDWICFAWVKGNTFWIKYTWWRKILRWMKNRKDYVVKSRIYVMLRRVFRSGR